jgi:hypothetical protein
MSSRGFDIFKVALTSLRSGWVPLAMDEFVLQVTVKRQFAKRNNSISATKAPNRREFD